MPRWEDSIDMYHLGSPVCHTIFVARNGIGGSESIKGVILHLGSKKEKQSLNLFFYVIGNQVYITFS
jgi:hypothetical protein